MTSAQRMSALPQLPTLVELFKTQDLAMDAWFGLWAPAGTPQPVVEALFKAVARAYEDASLRADAETAGALVSLSASPTEFTKFIEGETLKFDRLVKAARLSAGN